MVNRRQILASSGIALSMSIAGCFSPNPTDEGGSSEEDDSNEPAITDIQTDGESPLEYDISFSNKDHDVGPYELEVEITNTGDEPIVFGEKRSAFFSGVSSSDFVLWNSSHVSQEVYTYSNESGVWVLTDGIEITMEYQIGRLESGESSSEAVSLLHQTTEENEDPSEYPDSIDFSTSLTWGVDNSGSEGVSSPDSDNSVDVSFTVQLP